MTWVVGRIVERGAFEEGGERGSKFAWAGWQPALQSDLRDGAGKVKKRTQERGIPHFADSVRNDVVD